MQDKNAGISYEYALPKQTDEKKATKKSDKYSWSISVTACSEPCAGGRLHQVTCEQSLCYLYIIANFSRNLLICLFIVHLVHMFPKLFYFLFKMKDWLSVFVTPVYR